MAKSITKAGLIAYLWAHTCKSTDINSEISKYFILKLSKLQKTDLLSMCKITANAE